ncbi:hypothetical protein [Vibrio crassostreae]|uniref:hypothetical protein n=1 Tax=Vibrio crassostreae TaxID=246167 RepID=UPI001B30B73C|nr:hypothetical protein [Vibrio crassostreae]
MQNTYHEHVEKYFVTYEVGQHHYVTPYLKKTKTATTKLPIGMHRDGLMILGCQKSYRRRMTQHYAKTLIDSGRKVLFITDNLNPEAYRAEYECDVFCRHIGIDSFEEGEVHFEEITGLFNGDILENGAKLHVVTANEINKRMDEEAQLGFDDKLLNLLEEVIEDKRQRWRMAKNPHKNKEKLVVIIDEDWSPKVLDSERLSRIARNLHFRDVGFVICGHSSDRYRGVISNMEHFVFFRLKDAITDLEPFRHILRRRCIEWSKSSLSHKYHTRLDERDVRTLEPKEFYYFQGNLVGFSNRSTFDAGGCKCCLVEPIPYY